MRSLRRRRGWPSAVRRSFERGVELEKFYLRGWIGFDSTSFLGENGCGLRTMLRSKYAQRLSWLRTKRFGSEDLNEDAVFNLSDVKLSRAQLEILSRGPRFGIPVEKPCREEIFAEFELYFSQLQSRMPKSSTGKEKEKKDGLKASLANLAHEYSSIKQDPLRFPFGKEHIAALRELRNNKEIVITRPDKGNGTVLMYKTDYIVRMMEILGDETKFECLGGCDKHDRTGQIERALQAYLFTAAAQGRWDQQWDLWSNSPNRLCSATDVRSS